MSERIFFSKDTLTTLASIAGAPTAEHEIAVEVRDGHDVTRRGTCVAHGERNGASLGTITWGPRSSPPPPREEPEEEASA